MQDMIPVQMEDVEDYVHVQSLHVSSSTPAQQQKEKYPAKQHARRVAARLGIDKGLIYLPGQKTLKLVDSDMDVAFRQFRYIYYLTGVDVPDCHVTYDIAKDVLTLYVSIRPAAQSIWLGKGLELEEAEETYDIDMARSAADLKSDVVEWATTQPGSIYLLHDSHKAEITDLAEQGRLYALNFASDPFDYPWTSTSTPAHPFEGGSRLDTKSLQHAMDACRVIKDPFELSLLRHANAIAAAAHTAILRNLHSFKNERQVQAIFEEICTASGVTSQSYGVIAGSGPNAAVLHYMKNDEDFGDRQLLLVDAGPDWHCYASDVTRTFPISGKWPSTETKQIYDIVDKMQSAVISRLKPGIRMRDMQDLAIMIGIQELRKLGVLKPSYTEKEILESGSIKIFFPHGLGHHVGLEVHDVSPRFINDVYNQQRDGSQPRFTSVPPPNLMDAVLLEENMVITVEPGIYFSAIALEKLIDDKTRDFIDLEVAKRYLPVGGVRIEDDVLITREGHEVITTAPKGEAALRIIRGEEE